MTDDIGNPPSFPPCNSRGENWIPHQVRDDTVGVKGNVESIKEAHESVKGEK